MNETLKKYNLHSGFLALIALMLATRVHHFGSAFLLPDASLAVFFFAGLYCTRAGFFAFLLGLAALIDYVAISQFGVSDFCVSKAYIALIPAYGVMWLAGDYSKKFSQFNMLGLLKRFAMLLIAVTLAFFISNGSFYLFSGRYPEPNLAVYLERAALYYPPYLLAPLVYSAIIFAGLKFVALLNATDNTADKTI
jgi:hypothetical protein